jgi:site-specific recombinase XerD
MASMYYDKKGRRWRVCWHVTLPDGTIDSGSKTFGTDKKTAKKFKEHCEKRAKQIKRTVFVEAVFLDVALQDWEDSCLGYTEQTRKLYTSEVGKFIGFLSDDVVYISDLTTFQINSYLNSMMKRGLVNKTVNNTLCAVKSLCSFLSKNYVIPNPAETIKKLKEDPAEANFWTMDEYQRILMKSPDFVRPWIRLIAHTGLRATEFCKLRWRNCDLHGRTITVIGKGRKKRTIGLNDAAVKILEDMKDGRPVKPQDNVFLRRNGQPLSRYSLGWHIGEACRNAGLTGGGPHAARHFFATQLLLGGVPIIKVSALLGHGSVMTTQRHYSHILSSDMTDVTSILKAI